MAPLSRIDQEDAELGGFPFCPYAEHAPSTASVHLRDPGRLAGCVRTHGKVGDDPGDERLKARVPAELARVDLAVGHHDPTEVTGRAKSPNDRSRSQRTSY